MALAMNSLAIIRAAKCIEKLQPEPPAEEQITGDIDGWMKYDSPQDHEDLEMCLEVDVFNRKAWEYNRYRLEAMRAFLARVRECSVSTFSPPPLYTKSLEGLVYSKMFDPNFCFISAIAYLKEELDWTPFLSYDPGQSIRLAKEHASAKFIAEQKKLGSIDISPTVGKAHALECVCKGVWDGASEYCNGGVARLTWKTTNQHHFLRPDVIVARQLRDDG